MLSITGITRSGGRITRLLTREACRVGDAVRLPRLLGKLHCSFVVSEAQGGETLVDAKRVVYSGCCCPERYISLPPTRKCADEAVVMRSIGDRE